MNKIILNFKQRFTENFNKGIILPFEELSLPYQDNDDFQDVKPLLKNWYIQINNFDFLAIDNLSDLNEIFIHGPTEVTAVSFRDKVELDCDLTTSDLELALTILAFKNKIAWNLSSPVVSFQADILNHNCRVTLTHKTLSPENTAKAFIRFHNSSKLGTRDFHATCSIETRLGLMLKNQSNILIAGATGSGKTTFLNALMSEIPKDEHTIILEDTFELKSPHNCTTRMLADKDLPGRDLNTYMSHCMRMSPKRIILGEMRGAEVEPYLLAMNSGHRGIMSTVHANSAKDALDRLALLFKIYSTTDLSYELVLKLVTQSIDYVVYIEDKKVKEVIEVFGSEHSNVFYELIA